MSQGAPAVQTIGRYRVLGELGRGAMGVVYRAEDPNIGRTVALKTQRLDVQGEDAQELLRRLRQEARSAGILNHPNIVTIYDAGEQDALFYIAMEYIEGTTLQSMLTPGKPLPIDQIVEIARQICAGLDYAHQRSIVHRDIKPANIMITPEGGAKVMDFGIAKTGSGMTSAGQVLGTPSYMSPEQVKGKQLDGRSDLFSIGVILYEAVTGQKPFTGDNITTIIYKIVNEEPVPPRDLDLSVHPGLNQIITRALSKNIEERYQRGWDLARDLQNYKSLATGAANDDSDKTVILSADQMNAQAVAAMAGQDFSTRTAAAAATATAPAAKTIQTAAPAKPPAAAVAKPIAVTPPKSPMPMILVAAALAMLVVGAIGINAYRKSHQAQPAQQAAVSQPAATPAPPPQTTTPAQPTATDPNAAAAAQPPATAPATNTTPADAKKPDAGKSEPAASTKSDSAAAAKKAPTKSAPKTAPKLDAKAAAIPPVPVLNNTPLIAVNGQLRVMSVPIGADVLVDGKPQPSQTPLTLPDMTPGVHTVVISKAGYRSETRNVQVDRGQRAQINAILVTAMANVSANSTPVGASILVDGTDTGKLTPAQVQVPEGAHKVALKLQGWHSAETTVNLKAGDTYNFNPQLSKDNARIGGFFRKVFGPGDPANKGTLIIRTRPPGATVMINGVALPKVTPIPRAPMEPGKYHVTVKLQGYKTLEKDITLEKGQVVDLSGPLEKQ